MNTASLSEIKRELRECTHEELIDHCLRVAKYKRENKELLNYLLFEAHDEDGYIAGIKSDMVEMFDEVNLSSVYFAKKTIRKILRFAAKHIKYSGSKQTEVEILIAFCLGMRKLDLAYHER
jgi:HD superfamily phosphohydrolase YqeK